MSLRASLLRGKVHPGVAALLCLITLAAMLTTASCSRTSQPYAGKWVSKYMGKNFVVLSLQFVDGHYSGLMAMPKNFQLGPHGSFTDITSAVGEEQIGSADIAEGRLRFTTKDSDDENHLSMTLVDRDHATLELVGAPLDPFKLARVSDSDNVAVATDWPTGEPKTVSPEILALQVKLGEMAREDQAVRKAKHVSDSKMAHVDAKNYPELERIYKKYGWPAISLFGKKSAGEYWLLVQHQDSHLEFQQRVLKVMQPAADTGEASEADYAYLYDRVLTNEGKPQHWGTQTTCKNGKSVMDPVDDPAGLEQRRNELALIPLDQYLESLSPLCANSTSRGPNDKR